MASREDYIEKAKNQLDALNNKLDKLEAKAERASGELKNEIHQELNDLRASRTQVEGKLHELRSAGDAAWDDVKIGLEMAWKSLSESVDSAAQRFKS
ncbi:MAG: hypothetical protein NXH95_22215 [Pseudomonadaceae bacterium]|nr:hypothetical protein [Pseudomonadaceae bacterium]